MIDLAITDRCLFIKVENYVRNDKMSYVEALVEVCSEYEIDPEDMGSRIKGSLREKLEAEAIKRNVIKSKTARLF